jgi:DNA-binding HxlR family transcriptional regulator
MPPIARPRRSGCPISFSLDLFGDPWTLLVLRDVLLHGKRRFADFLASGEGIATNILADRLARIEAAGLVWREPDAADGRRVRYVPTDRARSLIPVLVELARWGATQDPATAAPPDFAPAYDRDREGVIAAFEAASRQG